MAFRQEAFEDILTIGFWFRRKFNLAPTDERYLNATMEEMALEFYRYQLYDRYMDARREGREVNSLDDLMLEEDFDKQLAEFDAQLEAEATARPQPIELKDGAPRTLPPAKDEDEFGELIGLRVVK